MHIMIRDVTPQWDMMRASCRDRLEQSGRLIKRQMNWALDVLGEDVPTRCWTRFANSHQKMILWVSLESPIFSRKF